MRRAVWAGRIWRRGEEELFVKSAPMTQKPAFRLMKLGDVQSVYHLQMPRWLFTDPRYTALSLEAKVAYTFLLNRFQLSRLNGWINDAGEVFIIYTRKSLADEMQVSYRKVIDSMKELSAAGLIWERRCGRGDANQIYLALVEHQECRNSSAPFVSKKHEAAGAPPAEEAGTRSAETELLQAQQHGAGPSVLRQEVPEQHLQKSQTGTSASTGTAHPEVPVSHPSYTDPNHTDGIHTESSQSIQRQQASLRRGGGYGASPMDRTEEQAQLRQILDNCDLWIFDPEDAKVFETAIERLFYSDGLRVGKAVLPQANIRSRLWDLDGTMLQVVAGKLKNNQREVRNPIAYVMQVIFSSINEAHCDVMIDPYINSLRADRSGPDNTGG